MLLLTKKDCHSLAQKVGFMSSRPLVLYWVEQNSVGGLLCRSGDVSPLQLGRFWDDLVIIWCLIWWWDTLWAYESCSEVLAKLWRLAGLWNLGFGYRIKKVRTIYFQRFITLGILHWDEKCQNKNFIKKLKYTMRLILISSNFGTAFITLARSLS